MTNIIKSYFEDWKKLEIVWLIVASFLIISISLSFGDSLFVLASSLAGAISVILCAKGKFSYLYFGVFQCLTYSYIAYSHQVYGEFMLNLFFVFPMSIITFFLWRKNMKADSDDVVARRLTLKQKLFLIPTVLIAIVAYSFYLTSIESRQVGLDSIAVVLSIVAQILLTLRYAEQWVFWIIINVVTVTIWVLILIQDGTGSIGTLIMWLVFLCNSIFGYINWRKISK